VITLTHVELAVLVNSELSPTVVAAIAETLNEVRIAVARITFAAEPTRETKLEKILFKLDFKWRILLFPYLFTFFCYRGQLFIHN
jgi:hypothetical protein